MNRTPVRQSQSGFTLVELAIVMIIIGLLIGGVLKGQELIDNARITASVKRVTPIENSMLSFQGTYGTVPGDLLLADATARMSDCTGDCAAGGGNGDGYLNTFGPTTIRANYSSFALYEGQLFWYQMAAAGLIDDVDARGTQGNTVAYAYGVTGPRAPIGPTAGFDVAAYDAPGSGVYTGIRGLHLVLHRYAYGNARPAATSNGDPSVATPKQAHQFDTKLDDGFPATGRVRALNRAGYTGCPGGGTDMGTVNEYVDTYAISDPSCTLIIKIGA